MAMIDLFLSKGHLLLSQKPRGLLECEGFVGRPTNPTTAGHDGILPVAAKGSHNEDGTIQCYHQGDAHSMSTLNVE